MYRQPVDGDREVHGESALLRYAALSAAGRFCDENEDAFAAFPEVGTFVVADGTGALEAAGPVAVAVAAAFGPGGDSPSPGMEPLAAAAHRAFRDIQRLGERARGSGVTLAALRTDGRWLAHAHVGDVRVYRYREGALRRVTLDHDLMLEHLHQGVLSTAELLEVLQDHSAVVTRALIAGESATMPDVTVSYTPTRAGDLFLVATRGITEALEDASIGAASAACEGDPERLVARLVETAEHRGSHENTTALAVVILE